MWIEPVKRISEDGTEYSLVLLDVEWEDSKGIPVSSIVLSIQRFWSFQSFKGSIGISCLIKC